MFIIRVKHMRALSVKAKTAWAPGCSLLIRAILKRILSLNERAHLNRQPIFLLFLNCTVEKIVFAVVVVAVFSIRVDNKSLC